MESQTTVANRLGFKSSYTNEFDQDQDGADIITPASGGFVAVKSVLVSTEATSGYVRVYFTDDENDEENTAAKIYVNDNPGQVSVYVVGDKDAPLKVESNLGADQNYFLLVNYS